MHVCIAMLDCWLITIASCSQAPRHSTNTLGSTIRSNSACSVLTCDDLWLPRRGIEPRRVGFREVDSTARPLPLHSVSVACRLAVTRRRRGEIESVHRPLAPCNIAPVTQWVSKGYGYPKNNGLTNRVHQN